MKEFLHVVAIMSYLAAGFAFVTGFAVPNSDFTWIMSGVFAICATVAAAGAAILSKLDLIVDKRND